MKTLLPLFIVLLSGCQFSPNREEQKKHEDSVIVSNAPLPVSDTVYLTDKPDECLEGVKDLLRKSGNRLMGNSLSPDSVDYWITDFSGGLVTIQVLVTNDEGHDVTVAWLELDLNKKTLKDITIDPDAPVVLKLDTNGIRKIIRNCELPKEEADSRFDD